MRSLLFVLIIMLPFLASADVGTGQTVIGPNDILRGHFTETKHLQGFNGPLVTRGHFVVAPKYGLIWAIESPFPTTTVITPAGLVQRINDKNVMHLTAQKIPFLLHLYDALGGALIGNWKALEADFIVTQNGDEQNWEVTLVPRKADNPAMPFSSITINGHRFVENVVMTKPGGDSDTLTFSNEVISSGEPSIAENHVFKSVQP